MIIEGPSRASISPNIILLSMIPRSFENLLTKIPEGVVSKKLPGHLTIDSIIFSCTIQLEFRRTKLRQQYLITRTMKKTTTNIKRIPQKSPKLLPKTPEEPAITPSKSAKKRQYIVTMPSLTKNRKRVNGIKQQFTGFEKKKSL